MAREGNGVQQLLISELSDVVVQHYIRRLPRLCMGKARVVVRGDVGGYAS
jgi:hypothetical protein